MSYLKFGTCVTYSVHFEAHDLLHRDVDPFLPVLMVPADLIIEIASVFGPDLVSRPASVEDARLPQRLIPVVFRQRVICIVQCFPVCQ